jgi:hypothetical protein
MKFDHLIGRGSRLGLSFILLVSFQANPAWAASHSTSGDAGLLPIEKSQVTKGILDDLFVPRSGKQGKDSSSDSLLNGGDSMGPNLNPKSGKVRTNSLTVTQSKMSQMGAANLDEEFKCNLFENVPYEDILSAVNTLNQAVNSPNCGDTKVNNQSIAENNKIVVDAVTKLRGFKENPDTIQLENSSEIVTSVDAAIRAASTIANTFAQTDIMKKECRDSMNAGDVAVAVGDIINGLTPYALMAASLTGGTAAIPFIVGGGVITGAVSSMAKIIGENSANVKDAQVRRAIVENTCQYIRLDQKYKFIIKSRQEQISKITSEISASKQLFSAKIEGVSGATNNLIDRKNSLDRAALEISSKTTAVRSQLELDKQFMNSTTDSLKICQLGVQLTLLAQDKTSYVAGMLGSLDTAVVAYGNSNIAQAQALKVSSSLAIKNLQSVAARQYTGKVDFNQCAQTTKSFVETIEQSATLAKQLVKIAQDNIDKGLQNNADYSRFKVRMTSLTEKQFQAERVTLSLDNLKAYATAISQSEIDSEMDRLRRGLFQSGFFGGTSPVLMWFKHVRGLHNAQVTRFQEGISSLRLRALRMTKSVDMIPGTYPGYYQVNKVQIAKDQESAKNLEPFNLSKLPLGTAEHDNVCRELNDVWNRWTVSIDHLAAMESFCSMIEPYVFDSRPEDRELVAMCRGFSKESAAAGSYGASLSGVASAKNNLVKSGLKDWALFLQKKMEALVCLDSAEPLE